MDIKVIINQVSILFLILIVGYIAYKLKIIDDMVTKKLSEILVKISMPALILISCQIDFTKEKLETTLWVLLVGFFVFVVCMILSEILYKNSKEDRKPVLKFATCFSNCGFMGFPVLYALMGSEGVFYAAIFQIPFNVFIWTYGVIIFKKHNDFKKLIKDIFNPAIIALILGFFLLAIKVRIPDPFFSSIEYIGKLTTPLSMIILGGTLGSAKIAHMVKDKMVYIITLLRNILIPLFVFVIMLILKAPALPTEILVLLFAMPCAAATTIFAKNYGGNAKLAASIVSFSTLSSLVTIPLVVMIISL